jgi:hypothetical protein
LIDLGDLYDIREIRLLTAQDQIQNTFHRIRYAKDASAPYRQWWDFKGTTHDNQWLAREENSGNTIQARYIKVETKDSASRAGWRQIELYGHRVTPPPRVIVFGWDGVQKNHFKDLYDKALLPTSRSLAEKGNLVEIYVTGNTHTKPGWATTLTGYDAPITGVYTNWLFQSIPADLTIFEKLHEHYGPANPSNPMASTP